MERGVEPVKVKKRRGPGKPFPKGVSPNPGGVPKKITTMDDVFLEEFFKEVDAMQGGQIVRATQYRFFVQELIKAGIKGGTPAKRFRAARPCAAFDWGSTPLGGPSNGPRA